MNKPVAETQLCVSCGALIPAGKKKCPNCGRPLAPRWPEKAARVVPPQPAPSTQAMHQGEVLLHAHEAPAQFIEQPTAPAPHFNHALPFLEFILGCFGFHGLTYYAVRKLPRATLWLVFDLVKHAIGATAIAFTAGLALICLVPLDIGISIYVALHVARTIRRLEHPQPAHAARA